MRLKAFFIVLILIMISRLPLGPALAFGGAATNQIQVAATILDRGHCSFATPGPYAINFSPALNPLSAIDRSASVSISVECKGLGNKSGTVIVDRDGYSQLYLKKGPDTIPYSINLPTSAPVTNNTPVSITLTATIAGTAYQTAPSGDYSDTITINVTP
jgi:hypothetical protein